MPAFSAKLNGKQLDRRVLCLQEGLLAALVVLIFACFSSVAQASCGDWLANPGHSTTAKETKSSGDVKTADAPVRPVRPCDGPMCQRSPGAPLLPPVPVDSTVRLEKLTVAAALLVLAGSDRQFDLAFEPDARPAKGFLPRVEHPPRV